ncbi:Bidirectional sugar transporter SWEET [Forsythia ovata]|uniref:Bidirectional sugar transporter SWEET n=1 Tax=Forsythia ovata TaxID=205694 RepID=A0ABD1RRC1_9LAMI
MDSKTGRSILVIIPVCHLGFTRVRSLATVPSDSPKQLLALHNEIGRRYSSWAERSSVGLLHQRFKGRSHDSALLNLWGLTYGLLGVLQMVLYVIYKNADRTAMNDKQKLPEIPKKIIISEEHKIPELTEQVIDIMKINAMLNA